MGSDGIGTADLLLLVALGLLIALTALATPRPDAAVSMLLGV